ncbi:glycosyltransferase [Oceanotoga teriensis]|jgi:hypothetical protein|uniref:glycosyltransferase n=1 Tax=Oceanotoga teriensis TaxID=515440 RepID=UPI00271231EB|nr:glycosyltransferase [Oceanotoga teriensis]MDO7975818.1 glycosyltransferase [Oceanotoga teriensis]
MILNKRFLPDIRVEKEIKELQKKGYRVMILTNLEGFDDENYEIIRLKTLNNLTKIFSILLISRNKMVKEIKKELKLKNISKIDFVHVHDLLWGFLGLKLSKIYKSKLIMDFHENYPAGYIHWLQNIKNPLIKNSKRYF